MQLVSYGFSKLIICKKKDILMIIHLAKKIEHRSDSVDWLNWGTEELIFNIHTIGFN